MARLTEIHRQHNISLGDTCLLWHDFWNGSILSQVLPQLFSFAKSPFISVNKTRAIPDVRQLFHLPISQDAFEHLLTLAEDLNALPTSDQQPIWTYYWGTPMFSPNKAYKQLISSRQVDPCSKWIWKSSAQKKT
jgi:hypothetical protein